MNDHIRYLAPVTCTFMEGNSPAGNLSRDFQILLSRAVDVDLWLLCESVKRGRDLLPRGALYMHVLEEVGYSGHYVGISLGPDGLDLSPMVAETIVHYMEFGIRSHFRVTLHTPYQFAVEAKEGESTKYYKVFREGGSLTIYRQAAL